MPLTLKDRDLKNRVLIVGAGVAGDMLVRDMLREGDYIPIGFIDDNTNLLESEIHGVRVLGTVQDIPNICEERDISTIIIAIPTATNKQMQKIISVCEETNCILRTLPSIQDMVSGKVTLNELKNVAIEDLLGREKVNLDWHAIKNGISDNKVLVTGGGGSIGSELCKQIVSMSPSKLLVFEKE